MAESKIPNLARDTVKQFKDRYFGIRRKLTDLVLLFDDRIFLLVERQNGDKFCFRTGDFFPTMDGVLHISGPNDSRSATQLEQAKQRSLAAPGNPRYAGYQTFTCAPPTMGNISVDDQFHAIMQLQQNMRQDGHNGPLTPEGTPQSQSNDMAFANSPMDIIQGSTALSCDGSLISQPHGLCTPAEPPTVSAEHAYLQNRTPLPSRAATPVMTRAKLRNGRLRKRRGLRA